MKRYGDSEFLRRSIFSMAGSFGQRLRLFAFARICLRTPLSRPPLRASEGQHFAAASLLTRTEC